MGCLLAIGVAMALIISVYIAATGSRLAGALKRLWGKRAAWSLTIMVLAAWGYKILSYKGWL